MKWYWIVLIVVAALVVGYFIPKIQTAMSGATVVPATATPAAGSTAVVATNPATGAKYLKVV